MSLRERLDGMREGRRIHLKKTSYVAMGAGVIVASLIISRLLTWLTKMAIGG